MSTSLLDLQRRMARAVMQPLTQKETMRLRRSDGAPMQSEAQAFIKPNDRLSSLERLEIYNRQYWFRLYSSFEEDFPGLQAVMGRKPFEKLMHAYLEACPSTSYTLRNLGARLSQWLEKNPAYTKPRTRLALDMARLEWAHIEAYDAAELPIPAPEALAAIDAESHLQIQPHVQLLELAYPVDDLLIQVRNEAGSSNTSSNNAALARKAHSVRRVAALPPKRLYLAVHRQQFTVYYKRLALEEYTMLAALQAGQSLGAALEAAFIKSRLQEQQRAERVQKIFQDWMLLHWLCHPTAQSSNTNLNGANA
jgi:hypothetical protein